MAAIFHFQTKGLSPHAEAFVPSVSKEDKDKFLSEEFGFIKPTKIFQNELVIPPFVQKPMTWADRAMNNGKSQEEVYYSSKQKGNEELEIEKISNRIKKNGVKEIILALDATINGQTTANYIIQKLKNAPVNFSSLAHGVPVGGELDYLDDGTIRAAFSARKPI